MHEWALAEAVLESVQRETPEGARVRQVALRLGELQAIDGEVFLSALRELAPQYRMEAAEFRFEIEPVRFACRRCGRGWGLGDCDGLAERDREAIHFLPEACHAILRCPSCGNPDFDVVEGRGVTVMRIEAERE